MTTTTLTPEEKAARLRKTSTPPHPDDQYWHKEYPVVLSAARWQQAHEAVSQQIRDLLKHAKEHEDSAAHAREEAAELRETLAALDAPSEAAVADMFSEDT